MNFIQSSLRLLKPRRLPTAGTKWTRAFGSSGGERVPTAHTAADQAKKPKRVVADNLHTEQWLGICQAGCARWKCNKLDAGVAPADVLVRPRANSALFLQTKPRERHLLIIQPLEREFIPAPFYYISLTHHS
ncbi:hypothetical protein GWI33_013996 [Rhynchophorus ferrugineus]|uniref:Uncharacterized protein n=1 Tax=Rhynchophorus ferrugineus TaxID=354439 RepID=A0A834M641_RHYFE|nr:hypothetical protein GWI33_013996 [Rhynchophorus ferrugineus]